MSQAAGSERNLKFDRAEGGRGLVCRVVATATAIAIAISMPPPAIGSLEGTVAIHERAVKAEGQRLYSKLEMVCEVVFPHPGVWDVEIALSDREQYFGWWMPGTIFAETLRVGPHAHNDGAPIGAITTDSVGNARLALQFDGNDLAHLTTDGPWHFCISANSLDSTGDWNPKTSSTARMHAVTRAWRREEFETVYSGELDPYRPFGWETRSGEELVFTQGWDLLVAEVVRADTGGTRGKPPRLTMRVDRALQGRVPLGRREASWDPAPSRIWCPVGEEANIARWKALPNPAPPVGSRWILGGYQNPRTGVWSSNIGCRWPYSDSTLAYFHQAVHTWRPKLAHLRQLYEQGPGRDLREQRARESREAPAREKAKREKAAAVSLEQRRAIARQTAVEKQWFARVRAAADSADLQALASQSDLVVLGRIELSDYQPRSGRTADVRLRIDEWLRGSAPGDTARSEVVRITPREDAVATLWRSQPPDTTPLGKRRPVRAIVFARRLSSLRTPYDRPPAFLRLVDGEAGMLVADARTIARARLAVVDPARSELISSQPPGATWQDFAGLGPGQAIECAVKLSPLFPSTSRSQPVMTLVLSSRADSTQPAFTREWIWSRALPDSNYRVESSYGRAHSIRSIHMAALLDSLTTLAPIRSARVEVTDSLSVTLTRVREGRVIQIERTLDSQSVERLAWMLLRMKPASLGSTPWPLDLDAWVSAFRPSVFYRYAKLVWEERYGKRAGAVDPDATPAR